MQRGGEHLHLEHDGLHRHRRRANPGLPVVAKEKLPQSTNAADSATVAKRAVNGNPSVSIVAGKKSSIVRIFGAAAVTCTVWSRSGNE